MKNGIWIGYHWLGESSEHRRRIKNIYNKEINTISGGLSAESSKITVIRLTQI